MKYRLEAPHYIHDMYLETGTIVGDDTGIPYRFQRDSNIVRPDGKRTIIKAGEHMKPSVAMFPLDKEAEEAYKERYGDTPPNPDPVERIPLMGNVQSSENTQPRQDAIPGAKGPTINPLKQVPASSDKPPAQAGKEGPVPGAPDNAGPK